MKSQKFIGNFIMKTLAVILAGVFLFTNTYSWAEEERLFSTVIENRSFSSRPANNNKLAPESQLNSEDFKYSLTVGAICKHVEHDGNLDDKSYLNDVLARLDADKNSNITVLQHEIIIEILNEGLAVRYFDPTKANVITPYSNISKLSTKVIGPRLSRQIIHRIKSLPLPNKSDLHNLKIEQKREEIREILLEIRNDAGDRELIISNGFVNKMSYHIGFFNLLARLCDEVSPEKFESSLSREQTKEALLSYIKTEKELLDKSQPPDTIEKQMMGEAVSYLKKYFQYLDLVYGVRIDEDLEKLVARIRFVSGRDLAKAGATDGRTSDAYGYIFLGDNIGSGMRGVETIIHELLHVFGDRCGIEFSHIFREGITQHITNEVLAINGVPDRSLAYSTERLIGIEYEITHGKERLREHFFKGIDITSNWSDSTKFAFTLMDASSFAPSEKIRALRNAELPEFITLTIEYGLNRYVKTIIEKQMEGGKEKDETIEIIEEKLAQLDKKRSAFPKVEVNMVDLKGRDPLSLQYEVFKTFLTPLLLRIGVPKEIVSSGQHEDIITEILKRAKDGHVERDSVIYVAIEASREMLYDKVTPESLLMGQAIWLEENRKLESYKNTINSDTNVSTYLQNENYFYPLLTQEMQGRVAKRITDLEKVVIETPDGVRRSIVGYIKHVLFEHGLEDKLEHVIVCGSYIFSSKPSDIDIKIGLTGNAHESDLLAITSKINISNLGELEKRPFKIIFPEDSDYAVSDVDAAFRFVGDSPNSLNRQEHLANLYLLSGAFIYGNPILQSQVEPTIFSKKVVAVANELVESIVDRRASYRLNSKKAVYRLLHAALIISRTNPTLLEKIKPKDVYKFFNRYFSEEIDQSQRAKQALKDLDDYLTPEKARSIYAYFLIPEIALLAESGDEISQAEAVEKLGYLTGYGNLEAFKHLGLFSKIDNPQVQLAVRQAMSAIKATLESKEGFKMAPEIAELNSALETLTLQVDKKTIKNQTSYITAHQALFENMLGENKPDTLVRVPVEVIEFLGGDNVKDLHGTFQTAPNGYVELYYMSGVNEVPESVYQKYGLQKKTLPKGFKRTRENTVTLFAALKGENLGIADICMRLGSLDLAPEDTILWPIGLQHDSAGLIRATIAGLKTMMIARELKEKGVGLANSQEFKDQIQLEILEQIKTLFDPEDMKNVNLTPYDIIALASGTRSNVINALKKLVKLLPVMPIDAEELRRIYEHVKAVIIAA